MTPASPSTALLTRDVCRSVWDCFVIGGIYKTTTFLDAFITPEAVSFPHPVLYSVARFSLWSLYGFWAGLFATGLWVVAHECGHQAFSESKSINNSVGWVLHSAYAFFSVHSRHVINGFSFEIIQIGSAVSFLENHPRKAPCLDRSYDSRPSVRSKDPLSTRFVSF